MENASVTVSTNGASRPWQGTLIGVVNVIGLVIMGIAMVFFIWVFFGGTALISSFASSAQMTPFLNLLSAIGGLILIPFAVFFVLGVLITRGIFKGKRWAIIFSLVLTILAIASLLFGSSEMSFPALAMNALMLYAEVICLKHPFYNQA
ncbi:hypothetical protein KKD70_00340 [Patescibacteria group bacterium]|nr:hypothetical protein [Patescibacteria group bacterium]